MHLEDTMAKTAGDFVRIKDIFSQIDELDIHERHGGKFRFPIYLTESLAKTDLEALELSVRSNNCLKRAGITTIGDLCERVHGSEDLKSIRNCGKTSMAEIMDHLFAYQYSVLRPERKERFWKQVLEMNLRVAE